MLVLVLAATGPAALAEELFLGADPSGEGLLTIVGLRDGTDWSVHDLEAGATVAAGPVGRTGVEELELAGVRRFAVRASEPVLVHLGYDCCGVGGSSFVPTEDGHSMVGRAFLLYLPMLGPQSDVYVFAVEDARVVLATPEGAVVGRRSLEAGRAWVAYPLVGARPYLVRSSGDIAIMLSAVNGLTTVPPASRAASCEGDVGRLFYAATHSWGGGAVAVFAYEEASVRVEPVGGGEPLAEGELEPGGWLFADGLGRRALRVLATGEVAVWAGDLEGGEDIEHMGDDFSVNLGRRGLELVFHSQSHGAFVFATEDGTTLTHDDETHELDRGRWLELEPGRAFHLEASAPVLALTFGGNVLNDWGGFLRPAPGPSPGSSCPELDADLPGGDGDADAEPDADYEADADPEVSDPPDGQPDPDPGDADARPEPRPSCDCLAVGRRSKGGGAALLRSLAGVFP